jgi:Flp pilus assembly protein CpaB
MAIQVPINKAAGGFIQSGSRVDVMHTSGRDKEPSTKLLMENIRVLAVDAGDARIDRSQTELTIVLEVSREQATSLALAKTAGQFTVLVRAPNEVRPNSKTFSVEIDRRNARFLVPGSRVTILSWVAGREKDEFHIVQRGIQVRDVYYGPDTKGAKAFLEMSPEQASRLEEKGKTSWLLVRETTKPNIGPNMRLKSLEIPPMQLAWVQLGVRLDIVQNVGSKETVMETIVQYVRVATVELQAKPPSQTLVDSATVVLELTPEQMLKVSQAKEKGELTVTLAKHALIPPGMRAVGLTMTLADAVGEFLQPGHRVDIILIQPRPDRMEASLLLEDILVRAIDMKPHRPEVDIAAVPVTVTLEMSPEQTQILTLAKEKGTLQLAIRSLDP